MLPRGNCLLKIKLWWMEQLLFSSVQSLRCVQLFPTPWTAAHQASMSITNSWSLLKLMSIKLMMPSNHLILCHPLLLPLSVLPSIGVFSNESVLCIRWPEYWSFSISPSNEYSGLIYFRIDWLDLPEFAQIYVRWVHNAIYIPSLIWKWNRPGPRAPIDSIDSNIFGEHFQLFMLLGPECLGR